MVISITNHLKLYLFPSFQRLLHQNLAAKGKRTLCQFHELIFVLANTTTLTTQSISRTNHNWEANLLCCFECLTHIIYCMAFRCLHRNLIQFLHKQISVLCIHNSFNRSTQHPNTKLFQDTFLKQVCSAIQCRLTTKSQENSVGTLFFNHTSHKISSDRQEVNFISNTFRCLNGSNIRIDQYRTDAFLTQRFQSLRARIVKLTCLAYFQRARSQNQYLFQILFHNAILFFYLSM